MALHVIADARGQHLVGAFLAPEATFPVVAHRSSELYPLFTFLKFLSQRGA